MNVSTSQHTRAESIDSPATPFSTEDTRFKKRTRYSSNTGSHSQVEGIARHGKMGSSTAYDGETGVMDVEALNVKRDEEYYFDDGSCILLVQDTLFNVHRSILSRDGSSFGTMFSLPQGSTEAEGKSDRNPVILHGDTVSEFKHFLWALYALPPELSSLTSPTSDSLVQLMDIARISYKYSFKSLETWSLDAIQEYVNRKPSPLLSALPASHPYAFDASAGGGFNAAASPNNVGGATTGTGTSPNTGTASTSTNNTASNSTSPTPGIQNTAQLTQLIHLAQLCNHEKLLNTLISLLRQLMSSSVQYAYLAMTIADELNLRSLRGAAYLEVMQKAMVVKKSRAVMKVLHGSGGGTAGASASTNNGTNDANNSSLSAAATSGIPTLGPVNIPPLLPMPPALQPQDHDTDTTPAASISSSSTPSSSPPLSITPSQQLRLLIGYYRLTSIWEQLRNHPPNFTHAPSCGATWHQHGCTQSWLEFWKEKTRSDVILNGFGLADVLGRLRQIQKDYDRWGSATYMHHDCRMAARKSIQECIKRVEDSLPDCFDEGEEE
ncbi:hypothetical protein AX16_008331 [Volvariella volvacea WC 439]|nr:hypothetical protein AX16_008331 [Volvariella volvacea WC 439]